MMRMSAIDLSSYAGLCAMTLLTVNILLGLLLSTKYNPVVSWPHRTIKIFEIHNWTAYVALGLALLHPFLLLASSTAGFHVLDILFPVWSPGQRNYNLLGALALYTVTFVVVTSYFRPRLGSRLWKKFHYAAYGAAVIFFTHGVLTDPELKNQAIDPFDGEKIFIEICALLVIAGTAWRIRYAVRR